MCSSDDIELKCSIYNRARRFYITRPWGMNIDPLTLSSLFENVNITGTDGHVANADSRVTLLDLQENQVCEIQIVTPQDSHPEKGRISILSPLGAALVGTCSGDNVSISVLGRAMKFKVLKVDQPRPIRE